ncbi:MAG: hypothetical protein ABI068_02005 [Ktedonobacterales bacterium]
MSKGENMSGPTDESDAAHVTALATAAAYIAPPDFTTLLRHLRIVAPPCLPPLGSGSFDILYVCEREVAVWYTPTREGQEAREVIIPGALLLAAWRRFQQATQAALALDESDLCALAGGVYGGRWLASLLTQLPGVQAQLASTDDEHQSLILVWAPLTATA